MFGLGECSEAKESDLPHVASLQPHPHEDRTGSLPPPVKPELHHLVVSDTKLRHPPVWIPAAPRPQKTLPHKLQQATMLRAEHSNIRVIDTFYVLYIKKIKILHII